MTELTRKAIETVTKGEASFCHFITANDVGDTGSHQWGFYIPKAAAGIFFEKLGERGSLVEHFIKVKWQDDFETDSRAIYYGAKTRNEYRLTKFGKGFPFIGEDYIGSLLVVSKYSNDYYCGFVLSTDDEIEDFLDAFGMSPADAGGIIQTGKIKSTNENLEELFSGFVGKLRGEFPETEFISDSARKMCSTALGISDSEIVNNPDDSLLQWINAEFGLFRKIEERLYLPALAKKFEKVDDFIAIANTVLNRRKCRAGKSLENHLEAVFALNKLEFDRQPETEVKKHPDFLFPGEAAYKDTHFDNQKLIFLASKTTCKDRWRQILNEADKIETKHLFTLQQGISGNQLDEMYCSKVVLVTPARYISSFPKSHRDKILALGDFVEIVRESQL